MPWLLGKLENLPITISRIWYPKKDLLTFSFDEKDSELITLQDHVLDSLTHVPRAWLKDVDGILFIIDFGKTPSELVKAFRFTLWSSVFSEVKGVPFYFIVDPLQRNLYTKAEFIESLGLVRYQETPLLVTYNDESIHDFVRICRAIKQTQPSSHDTAPTTSSQ